MAEVFDTIVFLSIHLRSAHRLGDDKEVRRLREVLADELDHLGLEIGPRTVITPAPMDTSAEAMRALRSKFRSLGFDNVVVGGDWSSENCPTEVRGATKVSESGE